MADKVTWFIHKAVLGDRVNEAINIIREFGDDYYDCSKDITSEQCLKCAKERGVIHTGLVPLSIGRDLGYYQSEYYRTSYYMANCSEYFLNQKAIYLPLWMLKKDIWSILEFNYEKVFIKPDSGFKYFTGFDVDYLSIRKEVNMMENVPDNQMIMIAPYKNVTDEYRFFVVNNKIITASPYSWDDDFDFTKLIPEELLLMAMSIVKQMSQWDYTLDMCYAREGDEFVPYALEVNCLNTSGVYNCNLQALMKAMRDEELRGYGE